MFLNALDINFAVTEMYNIPGESKAINHCLILVSISTLWATLPFSNTLQNHEVCFWHTHLYDKFVCRDFKIPCRSYSFPSQKLRVYFQKALFYTLKKEN